VIGWWELPGPSQFAAGVAEDLRRGRNVVLCLPEWFPQGLQEAVRAHLPPSAGLVWDTLEPAHASSTQPADWIAQRYLDDRRRARVRSPRELAVADGFESWLIWVDGVDSSQWPPWRSFLEEYEAACRQRPVHERALFCVVARGLVALTPPKEEVALSVRLWQAQVEPLDMFFYCWTLVRERSWPDLQRRLAAGLLSAVSAWDPLVADRLAQEPLENLLKPHAVLAEIAREREWERVESDDCALLWARGMADCQGGRWRLHSAVLALNDPEDELRSRLWGAEVSVVLPFLEEFRRSLLERYRAAIRLPHPTPDGRLITEHHDLELQHLAWQLARNPAVPVPTRTRLRRLANIRNRLAHLAILEPWELTELVSV